MDFRSFRRVFFFGCIAKLADYLRSNTRFGMAVFSLTDSGSATFSLAGKVGTASPELQQLWAREEAAAEDRRDARWVKVQSQQAELSALRSSLLSSKSKLEGAQAELQRAKTKRNGSSGGGHPCSRSLGYCYCSTCSACRKCLSACSNLEKEISSTQATIRKTERVETLLQPLPEDKEAALQVLFFMHMPVEFRSLSHLSFQAQQMLLPREWDAAVTAAVKRSSMDPWSAYYNDHRPARPGLDGPVVLGYSGKLCQPEDMVERCRRPSDGVWHPDSLAPGCMMWHGGSFSGGHQQTFCFDPFSPGVRSEWTTRAFTEQLSGPDQSLQWAMPQHGVGKTSPERANLAIVNQSDAPDWLGKRQFLAFGGVRAYPFAQLRKMALVLRDRSLPLGRPAVRSLMSQALYQIGELSTALPTTLLWRHDQAEVVEAIVDELKVRASFSGITFFLTLLLSMRHYL